MRVANRKQTSCTASGSPYFTVEQLAERWARHPKTIANGLASGKIPLRRVRPYPGADPLLLVADVEQLEAQAAQEAGA